VLLNRGNEPLVEEAVQLICETGGVAVLAHPWALKNPVAIIQRLKDAGLHGMEVYRSDGKLAGMLFLHRPRLAPFFLSSYLKLRFFFFPFEEGYGGH
jgi:hypothetical protein